MLLALMAQSFTSDVRTETQLTRNLMANGEARALADAAVHAAIDRLLRERSDANRAYDGSPYRTTLGGASVEVAIQDESGKIDLNAAPAQLLEKLFTGSGMEPDAARALVDAVADWRDRDTLRRLNGAEQGDYRLADRPYEPKNKAFDSIAELRLVLGVSPSLFERIRDAITVHSRRRGIDPRSATPTVLAALLGDDSRARDVIEARRGAESTPATVAALTPDIPRTFVARSPRNTFTIRAVAKTAAGATFAREAIIRIAARKGRPFTTLGWRRGRLTKPAPRN
jgi:general secretion pathway protein K